MTSGADYLATAAEQAVRTFLAGRVNRQPPAAKQSIPR